jgi:phospholipase C
MKARPRLSHQLSSPPLAVVLMLPVLLALAGCSSVQSSSTPPAQAPTISAAASPGSITAGSSSTLTVTASNATQVAVAGSDGSSYTLSASGGTQSVTPAVTTTYTATATGKGGTASASATVTVTAGTATAVTISANPTSIPSGSSSTLTVTAANATAVVVTGSDNSSFTLPAIGGTKSVSPTVTTTYTAKATGASGSVTATATVTVTAGAGASAINHVIFMMQENHTFDNYFGMLNPYRENPLGTGTCPNNAAGTPQCWNIGDDGNTYNVDGIDPELNTVANINNVSNENDQGDSFSLFKLASTCIDDATSGWLESYGDENRYNFMETRPIKLDGFVHDAEGYAASCIAENTCSGDFTDTAGQRAMGYYDQEYLNYYYYMASQFAVSDRWFSPLSGKSTPNRLATITGGTTQGLVFDPGSDDHIGQRPINTIFEALDNAGVSWKVYYSVTAAQCTDPSDCPSGAGQYPATTLTYVTYFQKYLKLNPTHATCVAPTQPSSVVGDSSNSFCIDPTHVALLSQYFTDLTNGTLPSFAYIEAGYGQTDEHPGSFQPVLVGQAQMAKIINAFMSSSSWSDSAFFFAYDEGGGPYDHVPPVPGQSNDKTDPAMLPIPDISAIAVNADNFEPCLPPAGTLATAHCDLKEDMPGALAGQAPYVKGFAAQLGFRVPNFVVSPFTRRHYVSHIPMDHTAVLKFVEDRFIGNKVYLTNRDAAQPDLLNFFDFNGTPWATPPTPPIPVTDASLNKNTCLPAAMGP